MNIPRREFEERQYIEAAFFLQVPVKKLRALHFVVSTPIEFNAIDSPIFNIDGSYNYYIKYYQNKVYYYGNIPVLMLLCSAYIISEKQAFQLQPMLTKLREWTQRNQAIAEILERHQRDLRYALERYGSDVPTFQLQNFSLKTINKIMAKHKGSAEFVGNDLKLTFNKIRCGNDIEGYVNYKSITVFLPFNKFGTRNLNSNRIIYTFQKFSLDTCDKINGIPALHPHISGGDAEFCFGNRDEDWRIYAMSYNFPFIIDLIYESLHTYNPSSPYIHISMLINVIKTLNMVYKDYKKLNPASTPGVLASHIFRGVNTCPKCYTILGVDGACIRDRCRANPLAVINCDRCGVAMERIEWDAEHRQYKWVCRNTSCTKSPDFIKPPLPEGTLVCRVCGDPLDIEDSNMEFSRTSFGGRVAEIDRSHQYNCYSCHNEEHQHILNIWQYIQDTTTGTIIDLLPYHSTIDFTRETVRWNEHQ